LHNIVNGIMAQSVVASKNIKVGVIPIGTGNDWVKTHKIPKDCERAIQIIKNGNIATQDLGKIEFLNSSDPLIYFNNLAGIGFDGYVVSKVDAYKNLGAVAYLLGAFISLFSFKNFKSKVSINSEYICGETLMILVGLCKYSGGGMQLTEAPDPFDGLLDVSVAKNFSKIDILKNLTKLFNGKINSIKKVQTLKAPSIKIKIDQNELPFIQADGELVGEGAINITLIPKAFSFYC
ncbi:MAG: diacylglycerol kinase (ATP), partial [Mariniflexile sp.]